MRTTNPKKRFGICFDMGDNPLHRHWLKFITERHPDGIWSAPTDSTLFETADEAQKVCSQFDWPLAEYDRRIGRTSSPYVREWPDTDVNRKDSK